MERLFKANLKSIKAAVLAMVVVTIVSLGGSPAGAFTAALTDLSGQALNYQTIPITLRVYNAASGGELLWEEIQQVTVANGVFTIEPGQGETTVGTYDESLLSTKCNWFELECDGDLLGPRQEVSQLGSSFEVEGTFFVATAAEIQADGTPTLVLGPGIATGDATLYGANANTHINLGFGTSKTGTNGQDFSYCTIGGGYGNTASGDRSTISGGRTNIASGDSSTVGGGSYNTASGGGSTVCGGDYNPASGSYSTVGGGFSNIASGPASTVGGGYLNTASGDRSTVGGGDSNIASGFRSTVGGGSSNTANANYSTVGGGSSNTASGDRSTVGGGASNIASGSYSTVCGGYSNTAEGSYSWTGGRYMQLTSAANSTFVWGYADTAQSITTADAFLIFPKGTAGKVGIGTASPEFDLEIENTADATFLVERTSSARCFVKATATAGTFGTTNDYPLDLYANNASRMRIKTDNSLEMANGATCTAAGVWTDYCSRDAKENIRSLTAEEALDALGGLNPVRYNYKVDKEDECVGFIAEDVPDLVATKGRKGMSPMDIVAVLTKVVQEQQKVVQEQQKVIQEQRELFHEQQKTISELNKRVAEIERR